MPTSGISILDIISEYGDVTQIHFCYCKYLCMDVKLVLYVIREDYNKYHNLSFTAVYLIISIHTYRLHQAILVCEMVNISHDAVHAVYSQCTTVIMASHIS